MYKPESQKSIDNKKKKAQELLQTIKDEWDLHRDGDIDTFKYIDEIHTFDLENRNYIISEFQKYITKFNNRPIVSLKKFKRSNFPFPTERKVPKTIRRLMSQQEAADFYNLAANLLSKQTISGKSNEQIFEEEKQDIDFLKQKRLHPELYDENFPLPKKIPNELQNNIKQDSIPIQNPGESDAHFFDRMIEYTQKTAPPTNTNPSVNLINTTIPKANIFNLVKPVIPINPIIDSQYINEQFNTLNDRYKQIYKDKKGEGILDLLIKDYDLNKDKFDSLKYSTMIHNLDTKVQTQIISKFQKHTMKTNNRPLYHKKDFMANNFHFETDPALKKKGTLTNLKPVYTYTQKEKEMLKFLEDDFNKKAEEKNKKAILDNPIKPPEPIPNSNSNNIIQPAILKLDPSKYIINPNVNTTGTIQLNSKTDNKKIAPIKWDKKITPVGGDKKITSVDKKIVPVVDLTNDNFKAPKSTNKKEKITNLKTQSQPKVNLKTKTDTNKPKVNTTTNPNTWSRQPYYAGPPLTAEEQLEQKNKEMQNKIETYYKKLPKLTDKPIKIPLVFERKDNKKRLHFKKTPKNKKKKKTNPIINNTQPIDQQPPVNPGPIKTSANQPINIPKTPAQLRYLKRFNIAYQSQNRIKIHSRRMKMSRVMMPRYIYKPNIIDRLPPIVNLAIDKPKLANNNIIMQPQLNISNINSIPLGLSVGNLSNKKIPTPPISMIGNRPPSVPNSIIRNRPPTISNSMPKSVLSPLTILSKSSALSSYQVLRTSQKPKSNSNIDSLIRPHSDKYLNKNIMPQEDKSYRTFKNDMITGKSALSANTKSIDEDIDNKNIKKLAYKNNIFASKTHILNTYKAALKTDIYTNVLNIAKNPNRNSMSSKDITNVSKSTFNSLENMYKPPIFNVPKTRTDILTNSIKEIYHKNNDKYSTISNLTANTARAILKTDIYRTIATLNTMSTKAKSQPIQERHIKRATNILYPKVH